MPRSGVNGTYTLPGQQANATPLEPISSSTNNQGWNDLAQTFNTVQPVPYGGTGSNDLSLDASKLTVKDGSDPTKRVAFNVSGVSTNTTRNVTVPNGDGTLMFTNTSVANAQASVGSVVDSRYTEFLAYFGSGNVIPLDDTIPTNTEGDLILSVTITPKSTTNKIRAIANIPCTREAAGPAIAAIHNGGAVALNSNYVSVTTANEVKTIVVMSEYTPGVTTVQTISLRIGPGTAGAMYLNGNAAGRRLGGSANVSLLVEEIKA